MPFAGYSQARGLIYALRGRIPIQFSCFLTQGTLEDHLIWYHCVLDGMTCRVVMWFFHSLPAFHYGLYGRRDAQMYLETHLHKEDAIKDLVGDIYTLAGSRILQRAPLGTRKLSSPLLSLVDLLKDLLHSHVRVGLVAL